jgi:cystathionine beta-lyase
MEKPMRFATKAIHAGQHPDPAYGAVMTPIYQTSTYAQSSPGKNKGYEYSRTHNPTRTPLQDCIAALENGQYGLCFASGLAATDAIVKLFQPGDEIIAANDMYGGTYRIFTKVYAGYGIKFRFLPLHEEGCLEREISSNTKMVWLETPTNPLLNIVDIRHAVAVAKGKGAIVVVDNTFATPYLQRPLDMGADIVMHSLTKYMAGHSDTVMGSLVTKDAALAERLRFLQNACGGTPGPQDCFLVLRGLKTLPIRMDAHTRNAQRVAEYLEAHPKVGRVFYPGLKSHPHYALAQRQMSQAGGMVSFELKGDSMPDAIRFMESIKVFTLAESLGGVESLCCHPATMTHASIPAAERQANGLKDTLIRLSVGIEDVEDLLEDLEQAIR